MNSITKKLLIVAGALIILGTALGITATTMVGFNWASLGTRQQPYEEKSYTYDLAGITDLSVSDVSADVIFVSSNEDAIKIDCYENEKEYYDINVSANGQLRVNYSSHKRWFEFIGINFHSPERTLTVSVPSKFTGAVNASTVSGDITMSKLGLSEALAVSTTSGEISLNDIVAAGKSSAASVSGDIELKAIKINGDLKLSTTSGSSKVSSAQIAGDLSLNSISGDDDLEKTTVENNVSLESTSGKVVFNDLIGNDISISTISGDVSGNIIGDPNTYSIKANTVSGDINLPPSANGTKLLDISTTSGDIDITINAGV
ncbi:DUF4097 family beta strand repeat-containing protein [Acetobacterium bakii]|uniref:DUF4097 domain-containing protein n=1 Tax=Acetobacterium bakii TaxID=52689 RepID=A0A0L6TWS2_9FIRM|nr:DUF4097 family beta strand repeat-containing protein [Acetobacterium bakii]KNZ40703.1 hypothetical protein AKG39_16065 [Acetobacterium bakii]